MAENISKDVRNIMIDRILSSRGYIRRIEKTQIIICQDMIEQGLPLQDVLDSLRISKATWFRRLAEARQIEELIRRDMNLQNNDLPYWAQLRFLDQMVNYMGRAAGGGASGSGAA